MNMTTAVETAIATAQEAGRAIMQVYEAQEGAQEGTTYKADNSPLTQADLASHHIITERLERFGLPLLSEESKAMSYEDRRGWTTFWLVDPLDGTKEFIKRNGEFTVNIALIRDGEPVLGVVHAPVLKTTYWGAEGLGAFKRDNEGEDEKIHTENGDGKRLNIVASRSHAGAETEAFLAKVGEAYELSVLSIGSSLKFCLVAAGAAQLYPRFGPTMEWDTAAAQCVVEGAGGRVTDLAGKRLSYNKSQLLNSYFMVSGTDAFAWQAYLPDLEEA